jgi:hypothetical protein
MRASLSTFKGGMLAMAGVAAALVIAVAVAGVLVSVRIGGADAQPSATAAATSTIAPSGSSAPAESPSAASSPSAGLSAGPSASAQPAPTMMAGGFTTPGATSGWTGFIPTNVDSTSTSFPTRFLKWNGGYVASAEYEVAGKSNGLWVSPNGQTWIPVRSIQAPTVLISVAPVGLVAIEVPQAGDAPLTPGNVWTSSDGQSWHNAGRSNLPGTLVSIAGTDSGIVATVEVAATGDSKAGDLFFVYFSTDGTHWTRISAAGGIPYMYQIPPHVQSAGGRFFLMGMPGPLAGSPKAGFILAATASPHDVTLWSDDGRTWTQSGGSYTGLASSIEFGRDGMLMKTDLGAVPGGSALARSNDGGKTWQVDPGFGPLGAAACSGECSLGPDGQIASNGMYFLAVKNGGGKAWLSYDGRTWTPVPWNLGDPQNGTIVVFPRGVAAGQYGAAK